MTAFLLAIDQGTTSSRAVVYDADLRPLASAQQEFAQHYPKTGWVEHDPQEIWSSVLTTCRQALAKAGIEAQQLAGLGITNQRETTLVWDRATGQPIYPAIVWQDRRTTGQCASLKARGLEDTLSQKTGLLLDPYFSGTKLAWILDHVQGARAKAEAGGLAFGTIDTWLIWQLTGGARHVTDATNAARTLMYNIHDGCWDSELLAALTIPQAVLPQVLDCAADFGTVEARHLGAEVKIYGVAGDQHAATIGQACLKPGMMKATYGTGCFAMLNTGAQAVMSQNRMLTTIAYQLDGKTTYALEGSIFIAGAVVQWLRDAMGLIDSADQSAELALRADPEQAVYLVPAFTGLGAPYWNADARGTITGLNRNSGPAELAQAALESVGYQTWDLLEAMRKDWPQLADTLLRVDGGMVKSDWAMQFLADILDTPVERPQIIETTALGAAALAGLGAGVLPDLSALERNWRLDHSFTVKMDAERRSAKRQGWRRAIAATQAACITKQ